MTDNTPLSDFSEKEIAILHRLIEICEEAKASGNNPFGCLLADEDGQILMEQGNAEHDLKGDCTAHAETMLMRRASVAYSREDLSHMTMYTSNEPCAMCSGAIYWGGLKGVVFIGSETTLKEYTGDDPRNPTLNLPCRDVFAAGQKKILVRGPVLELEPKLMKVHEGFWKPSI
ncbi:MAG: nucleoside deaminase [Lachnospiraceae bacterium]|nr:nucleoside deaminase [Candidatus Equihabitans merdae]